MKKNCNNCKYLTSTELLANGKHPCEACYRKSPVDNWEEKEDVKRKQAEALYVDFFRKTGIDNCVFFEAIEYFKKRIEKSLTDAEQNATSGQSPLPVFSKYEEAFKWILD